MGVEELQSKLEWVEEEEEDNEGEEKEGEGAGLETGWDIFDFGFLVYVGRRGSKVLFPIWESKLGSPSDFLFGVDFVLFEEVNLFWGI